MGRFYIENTFGATMEILRIKGDIYNKTEKWKKGKEVM